jgi:predicted anti-sigma-YlaC factor YlaD
MKCSKVHRELIFYLGGELSKEKTEVISRHLGECDECRGFLELLKEQMQLIENEKRPEVSPYFFTRVSARLDEDRQSMPVPATRKGWLQPALFTVLLLAGIAGGILLGNQASVPVSTPPEYQDLLLMNDFEAEPIESFLLSHENEQ